MHRSQFESAPQPITLALPLAVSAATFDHLLEAVFASLIGRLILDDTPRYRWNGVIRQAVLSPDLTLDRFDAQPAAADESQSVVCAGWFSQNPPKDASNSGLNLCFEMTQPNEIRVIWSTGGGDLFFPAERFLQAFGVLLQALTERPEVPLLLQPITVAEDLARLATWNDTAAAVEIPENLSAAFERIVQQHADRTAVYEGEKQLTYRQLAERAAQLAFHWGRLGLGPGQTAALILPRGSELAAAMLAVLQCGAVFVALDPALPPDRKRMILEDAGIGWISAQDDHSAVLPGWVWQILPLAVGESGPGAGQNGMSSPARGRDPAVVLYTSGSTGKPKGVIHTHASLLHRFDSAAGVAPYQLEDVTAQSSPLSSIDAVDEILIPLMTGSAVAFIADEIVKDPFALVDALGEFNVSRILLVPSLLRVILEHVPMLDRRIPQLRTWLVGGEALTRVLAEEFAARLPFAELINFYGLTEGDASAYTIRSGIPPAHTVPIGKPIRNTRVYILDPFLQPVPPGAPGEICIAGAGLAQGYLNRPELTAERFVNDPFLPGAVLYRTGDLGKFLDDGNIVYLGRRDRQVKIRGYRVEPGEVEGIAAQVAGVRQALVTVRERPGAEPGRAGLQMLVLYAAVDPAAGLTPQSLRDWLAGQLPEYALPSAVMFLERFPLNPNGKVDLNALPEPQKMETQTANIAARDEVEQFLVRVWEKVLGVAPIYVNEDFFELGGDSLAAIAVLAEVARVRGKNLPVGLFLQARTIADFAEHLRGESAASLWTSLVAIQPKGSQPPLYCVHAEGGVLIYHRLAELMGTDQPIYGLQAQGLDGRPFPFQTTAAMAAHYLEEILQIQPHGPYYLAGFSMGGFIIYEIAQQLLRRGEQVALLAFFDAYGPNYPIRLAGVGKLKYKLYRYLDNARGQGAAGVLRYLVRRANYRAHVLAAFAAARWFFPRSQTLPHGLRYHYVEQIIDHITEAYQPEPYPGKIVIFKAELQPQWIVEDPTLGWAPYAQGGVQVEEVPGDHNSILKPPDLHALFEKFKKVLETARKG